MAQLNTYSTNQIQAMGSGSLTLIADQKISLVSTNNVVMISGNTIVTLGPMSANRTLNVVGTLSAGTFASNSPVYVSSASTINLIAPNLVIQGSTIETAGYFISTGSLSSSHVISANTLVVSKQITGNSLNVIGKSTLGGQVTISGTLNTNTIATTGSNSFLVSSSHNISLVASNAGEINLTAVGDRVVLTANTISVLANMTITGRLYVSGTITSNTFVANSPMKLQASSTITLAATTIAMNATSFISLASPTKIQSGLLSPSPTYATGYTLTTGAFVVSATLNTTNKTFYLPATPLNGQMFYIKAIAVVGGASATLTINSNGKNIDGDPVHTQITLATSGSAPGGFVELIYHDTTNLWLVLSNYRATFA